MVTSIGVLSKLPNFRTICEFLFQFPAILWISLEVASVVAEVKIYSMSAKAVPKKKEGGADGVFDLEQQFILRLPEVRVDRISVNV